MLNYFVFALPLFLLTIFFIKWFSTTKSNNHLPPSPPRLPIIGNLHQLGSRPHRSLQHLAQRYGELIKLHFGSRPVIIVSSADAACEIMKTNDLIFASKPILTIIDKLLYQGKSVSTAPYGEYWRHLRSICVHQLLSKKKVQSFRRVREEEVALIIENVKQSSLLSLPVNLSELFASLTNDVICRVAFGRKYSGDEGSRKFMKLLDEFMKLLAGFCIGDFVPWLSWVHFISGLYAKVEKVHKQFDEFLDTVVEEHMDNLSTKGEGCDEEGQDAKDFVDVLIEAQKNNTKGSSIDRDGIKAVILDMFAGGTDTTYTSLEWAMTELVRHPRVMHKLRNEIMGIANGQQDIKESDLEKMQFLKAVIKETLRLYPPIPLAFLRESAEDVTIKGYNIAARTMVIINAWAIARDPSMWDEPEAFRPERFMNSSVDFKGLDFQLIPFGAGRRGCPGILFAMATNELLLANLVHKFDWEFPNEARDDEMNVTECNGLVIHRQVPLIVMAKVRSS